MNMDYKEKLKDQRWVKRRMEIMERDNHRCMICGEDTSRLNVHHLHYKKGAEPWEYGDNELATLCEDCHKMVHDYGIHLEVKRSKISDRYRLCFGVDEECGIEPGTIMASDMMGLIFVCADAPMVKGMVLQKPDGGRTNPLEYPLYREVEAQISVNMDGDELEFNEYSLPIDGIMSVEPRPATKKEKELLLESIKRWIKE